MQTQFKHYMDKRRTYSIETPSDAQVERVVSDFIETGYGHLSFRVGVARVHPLDNFCKKTGRAISTENAKMEMFEISGIFFDKSQMQMAVHNSKYEAVLRYIRSQNCLHVVDIGKRGEVLVN